MSDQTKNHQGGQVQAAEAGDSHYRGFHAFQSHISERLSFTAVMGEVLVANPGVEVTLSYAVPQGINPTALLLHIEFYQRPGIWPQVMTWKNVSFFRPAFGGPTYSEAEIVSGQVMVVRVPVQQM